MYFPTRVFSRGLSPGVTSGPFRNTLGFGAKAGGPRMRLRLFERLGRLVGWRPGWQGAGSGRPGDSRADGADVVGRHRRGAGAATGPPSSQAGSPRQRTSASARQPSAMQPPAGLPKQPAARLPRRSPQAGPAPRSSNARSGGPALPPLPRNYSPAAGAAATRGGAGGGGRARIREAPQFGAAPVDTATREPAAPGQPRPAGARPGQGAAAVRQPAPARSPGRRRRPPPLRSA